MPTPRKGPRLGKDPAHQRLMLANLAASLFEAEHVVTTETKAKVLRPYAEQLITQGEARRHPRPPPGHRDDPRQARDAQALRRDRAALLDAPRRVPAHPQARPAAG